jgi:hypothetical protein
MQLLSRHFVLIFNILRHNDLKLKKYKKFCDKKRFVLQLGLFLISHLQTSKNQTNEHR